MLRHSAQAILEQLAREAQAAAERTDSRLRRTERWAEVVAPVLESSTNSAANPWTTRADQHAKLLSEAEDEINCLSLLLPAAADPAVCQPS